LNEFLVAHGFAHMKASNFQINGVDVLHVYEIVLCHVWNIAEGSIQEYVLRRTGAQQTRRLGLRFPATRFECGTNCSPSKIGQRS
jgi:hypothetical protein